MVVVLGTRRARPVRYEVDRERSARIVSDCPPRAGDAVRTVDDELDIEQLADIAQAGGDRKGRAAAAFGEDLRAPFDCEGSEIAFRQRTFVLGAIRERHLQVPDRT